MAPRKKPAAADQTGGPSTKKTRTSAQPGIAAAFAAARPASAGGSLPKLVQERPHDLLAPRLTQELASFRDKYLVAWGDKCYAMREGVAAAAGSSRRAAAEAKEEASKELDAAALRYLESFRHLQQQAFKHGAGFDPRELELLALMTRCDAVHMLGDVSHQAYSLLQGYLQRYPYASLGRQADGPYAGRPVLLLDERAAWNPLTAREDAKGLTRPYIFEESIKDAGQNYRLDHRSGTSLLAGQRKKGGHLQSPLELLKLCVDRAVDSVEEDHNGDVLLLRYLLGLLHQDLHARLKVFRAYADVEGDPAERQRFGVLQNSLLWRIWADEARRQGMARRMDKSRLELVRLLMKLIVGVASEEELQEVEEEAGPAYQRDPEADEQANPCICTPRELAAMAGSLLGMLLDCFGAAEAAGGFRSHKMHRYNLRLKLDQAMKELMWKNASEAVCLTDEGARAFLAALAPAHRLRLLSLVACKYVGKAYGPQDKDVQKHPCLKRAQKLEAMATSGDCEDFDADPLVALECLNVDKTRCLRTFANVSGDSAANNLAVLACGIALAAHTIVAAGGELRCSGSGGGGDSSSSSGGEGGGQGSKGGSSDKGLQRLRQQVDEFLQFLAEKHRESLGGKREHARELSRASLLDLLHAKAAVAALG